MFTGLIETQGQIEKSIRNGQGLTLTVRTPYEALALGDSVAVDGACLTVTHFAKGVFNAQASNETLSRTTLGRQPVGATVHLERALRVGDRMGGHFVSGHVDGLAQLLRCHRDGDAWRLSFKVRATFMPYIASKGSVTLDGVSLTVNEVKGPQFGVVIVSYTAENTHLTTRHPGSYFNLETDILAKYVHRGRLPYGAHIETSSTT